MMICIDNRTKVESSSLQVTLHYEIAINKEEFELKEYFYRLILKLSITIGYARINLRIDEFFLFANL